MQWTASLDDVLRKAAAAGYQVQRITTRLTEETGEYITTDAVRARLRKLGIACRLTGGKWVSWTPEIDAELRKLVADGLSYQRIAETLNRKYRLEMTRNAAIGRATRIGIAITKVSAKHKRVRRAAIRRRHLASAKAAAIHKRMLAERQSVAAQLAALPAVPLPPSAPDLEPLVASIADLEPHHCRYTGDDRNFRFCGREKLAGLSWCAHHARRVFAVAPAASKPVTVPATRVA